MTCGTKANGYGMLTPGGKTECPEKRRDAVYLNEGKAKFCGYLSQNILG